MRLPSFAILASLLIPVLAFSQKVNEHKMHHTADEFAKVLDDPQRDSWQKPHEVMMALAIKSGEVVADVGAGTGYFARRFARHTDRVYAIDIAPKLLEIAKKHEPKLEIVVAAEDDPKLAAGSIDTIFLCNVLHHIGNRAAYLPKLKKALKPGGRIVVLEFHKRETKVGPPVTERIAQADLVREFAAAGFRQSHEWTMLETQYFLEFKL